jgi:hypothetical protein
LRARVQAISCFLAGIEIDRHHSVNEFQGALGTSLDTQATPVALLRIDVNHDEPSFPALFLSEDF